MFTQLKNLEGLHLAAEDGEIGHVTDLYFDDATWVVRYLVVATGSWLFGKRVLISPNGVEKIDWGKKHICVALSREQVRNSPDIDTDRPISRKQEAEYHLYYNFPPYWGGAALWGRYEEPGEIADGVDRENAEIDRSQSSDRGSNLRSAKEVRGYRVIATNGEAGHIDTFLMNPDSWAIRYLVINTGNWLSRNEVLCTPKLIDSIEWADAVVKVNTSRELMESAPHYSPGGALARTEEIQLFEHFTIHPYWEEEHD
jgi:uncharacterized protein YrrD